MEYLPTNFYNTWEDLEEVVKNIKDNTNIFIFLFESAANPDIHFIVDRNHDWNTHFLHVCTFTNGMITWKNPSLTWYE